MVVDDESDVDNEDDDDDDESDADDESDDDDNSVDDAAGRCSQSAAADKSHTPRSQPSQSVHKVRCDALLIQLHCCSVYVCMTLFTCSSQTC